MARTSINASNSTRERIVQTSLQLFNDEGLPSVSTHRIAAELGMSPGNLHYHFKTKQLIVERLLRRFEEQMLLLDGSFGAIRAIDDLWLALHLRFEAINAYRFVYRDMSYLASEYPVLGTRVQALTAQNLLAAQALCQGLVTAGVIEAERRAGAGAGAADGVHHHLLAQLRTAGAGARCQRTGRPWPRGVLHADAGFPLRFERIQGLP